MAVRTSAAHILIKYINIAILNMKDISEPDERSKERDKHKESQSEVSSIIDVIERIKQSRSITNEVSF